MTFTIDYRPLSERVTYRETLKRMHTKRGVLTTLAIATAILILLLLIVWVGWLHQLYIITYSSVAIIVYVFTIYDNRRRYQILKFTDHNNGLHLIEGRYPSEHSGMIFDLGHSRSITRAIATSNGRPFQEIANYTYDTGHGKSRRTHSYGFMCIALPRHLPHMILDAKGNNFLRLISTLPIGVDRNQTLSLEGDFNKHFTLYAPKKYETDALYVFTPDIMQIMIDDIQDYDVEIVDNMMYLYSNRTFNLTSPKRLQQLVTIADTIYHKLQRRTDYYSDSRVDSRHEDRIADHGRRLKNGIPTWAIIITLLVIGLFALITFS